MQRLRAYLKEHNPLPFHCDNMAAVAGALRIDPSSHLGGSEEWSKALESETHPIYCKAKLGRNWLDECKGEQRDAGRQDEESSAERAEL